RLTLAGPVLVMVRSGQLIVVVTVDELLLVFASPPPLMLAVLVNDVAPAQDDGDVPVMVATVLLPPAAMAVELVQVTLVVPIQVQPAAGVTVTPVSAAGSVSVTVIVPKVGPVPMLLAVRV